ncbi:hypothetical protein DFJ68_2820 [Terracoccus luteus]|uniref:Uncharacterized protein n=1 Tax=Terracoccus luteus TaxID=53356 RepID=A0A495Y2Z0_9MICO|nr:hypothetical protein [Terracoccus luteus]MCP2171808.1 hypothetical protein [Terracoccus luteus]RKT79353.1 hypothetical protein DFJ68_2820 [Terracoccus luteus]
MVRVEVIGDRRRSHTTSTQAVALGLGSVEVGGRGGASDYLDPVPGGGVGGGRSRWGAT